MSFAVEELYTRVRNLTDGTKTFGFLGPRGMRLAADEVVALPGDLRATLGAQAARGKRRQFDAMERSLANGILQIDSVPAPILYDPTDAQPYALAVDAGTIGVVDPNYSTSDSA